MLNDNTVFRVSKSKPSNSVPDEIYDHPDMSFDLKGLLSYCLRRPDGWKLKVSQVISAVPEGKTAIYTLINKLILFGFIRRTQERLSNGRMGKVIYDIYDTPFSYENPVIKEVSPQAGKPEAVKTAINNNTNNLLRDKKNNCYSDEISEETDFFMHDWVDDAPECVESQVCTTVEKIVDVNEKCAPLLTASLNDGLEAQHAPDVPENLDGNSIAESKVNADIETTKLWPSNDALPKSKCCLKHCLSKEYRVELILGESLTSIQFAVVTDVAKFFSVRGAEKELAEWISLSLLSPVAFGRCKTFVHKLNAIIKKIKEETFNRPRYSAQSSVKIAASQNALSAAHNLVAKRVNVRPEETQQKLLRDKIRIASIQLASAKSAMIQFKKHPDMVNEHKNSAVHYEDILAGLRAQKTNFNREQKNVQN